MSVSGLLPAPLVPSSRSEGPALAAYRWRHETSRPRRGSLLMVHGLGEHLGRYEGLAQAFTAAGFEVAGVDLRGFGRSGGRRGHVRRWQDYVDDLDRAMSLLAEGPCLILAHSMGGLVTLDWLAHGQEAKRAKALILSGPLVGNAAKPPAWQHHAAALLSHLCPILPFPNGIPMEDLCTDPAAVEAFRHDPLRVGTVTPRWYTEMLAALDRVWQEQAQWFLPLQLHVAEEERIIDREALARLADTWTGPVETLRWPHMRHEIMHEPAHAEVEAAMVGFALKQGIEVD